MSEHWDDIEAAPAKINLALHVTGRRADGFHTLESLVTFADRGDVIRLRATDKDGFSIDGPFAATLLGDEASSENLVTRARDALRTALGRAGIAAPPVHIHLEKNLPVASGIGGGSADAAAALRALLRHWQATIPEAEMDAICLSLGADVPMCFAGHPLIARGVGEDIEPLDVLPSFPAILVNPGIGVSTPDIFRRLNNRENPPLPAIPEHADRQSWLGFLSALRNDLQPPAEALVNEIGDALELLEKSGSRLSRMSGSGATCFGLYESDEAADAALSALEKARPGWYFLKIKSIGGRQA